jgi:hypothetical protein
MEVGGSLEDRDLRLVSQRRGRLRYGRWHRFGQCDPDEFVKVAHTVAQPIFSNLINFFALKNRPFFKKCPLVDDSNSAWAPKFGLFSPILDVLVEYHCGDQFFLQQCRNWSKNGRFFDGCFDKINRVYRFTHCSEISCRRRPWARRRKI